MIGVKILIYTLLLFIIVQKKSTASWHNIDSPRFLRINESSRHYNNVMMSGDILQYAPLMYAGVLLAIHKDTNIHKIRFDKANFVKDTFSLERYKNDGLTQFVATMGFAIALGYIMKFSFNRMRPNTALSHGIDDRWFMCNEGGYSFPSGHTIIAWTPSFFIAKRYGWAYSIPSFIVAGYVSYSRIATEWHYIVDVLGGIGVSFLSAFVFSKPYKIDNGVYLSLQATGFGARAEILF